MNALFNQWKNQRSFHIPGIGKKNDFFRVLEGSLKESLDPLDQNFGGPQFGSISVFWHQLEPNRQSDGLHFGGHNEKDRYEELRGDVIFLIGFRGMVEVDIDARSFCRGAWDLSVIKSQDDSISADQLETK